MIPVEVRMMSDEFKQNTNNTIVNALMDKTSKSD
jgi:hypothetical protein